MALRTLYGGMSGSDVAVLQQILEDKVPGWNTVGHDGAGVFGSSTTQAVRDFQAKSRLTVDGIVGPNTWRALGFDPAGFIEDEIVVEGSAPASASLGWVVGGAVGLGLLYLALGRK